MASCVAVLTFDETGCGDVANDVWTCVSDVPSLGRPAFFWRKVRERIVWQIQWLERRSRRTEAVHRPFGVLPSCKKLTSVEVQFMLGAVCSDSWWFLPVELQHKMKQLTIWCWLPFPCLACWEPNTKCRRHQLLKNMMQSCWRRSCPASFLDSEWFW